MEEMGTEAQQEFIQLADLCIKKTSAINRLMSNLEAALKDLTLQDSNEITLAALQDVNEILNTLISTWDQWAVGMSKEMDMLGQFKK